MLSSLRGFCISPWGKRENRIMQYKDLVKIRVWSIYRNKERNRILLPDKNIIGVIKAANELERIKLRDDKL
jgi:hypothetical protein